MSDIGGKSRSAVTPAASGQSGFGPQLDTFREVRRNLEASVLPLATSVDGRRFSFQASLYGLELQVGSYVVLEGDGTRYLGQVLTLGLDRQPVTELTLPAQSAGVPEARTEVQIRYASGEGTVYATSLVCRAATPETRAHVPYNIILVDAAEGFRMMAHGDNDLAIGDRVTALFVRFAGRLVPYFTRITS